LIRPHVSVILNQMPPKSLSSLLLFLLLAPRVYCGPFCTVFIDSETERLYGQWPLDRRKIAQGMDAIRTASAKAIVLKFFYDLPKTNEDPALAAAISAIPCAIQARILDDETNANPLPPRFWAQSPIYHDWIAGNSGWLPIPLFAGAAQKLGFVDMRDVQVVDWVPLLECYRNHPVESLYCCALEFATGAPANFGVANRVFFGRNYLEMNSAAESQTTFPDSDNLDYIPFHELLGPNRQKWTQKVAGSVVILGYDGGQIPSFTTKIGNIKAHRLFVYQLESLYKGLKLDSAGQKLAPMPDSSK
jgi:hypothetical protein